MSSKKFHIAILASGNGSNAAEIVRYFKNHIAIDVALLLSNNSQAYVLERARQLALPAKVFTRDEFKEGTVLQWLQHDNITHIVLAGFLWLIPHHLVEAYPGKIINIHPALLPKFGGKGMYGLKVHEAVKAGGETETGITIHLVNENYDEGAILFQERCAVQTHYTPQQIAECVHQLEHAHYPKVIEQWIMSGK
jgi:phosphoribosylglycinamide formyltransferase 1